VYLLQGLGIETGIDLDRLIAAGQRISRCWAAQPVRGWHGRVARSESHRCHMGVGEVLPPTFHSKKSGNRETNRQNFRPSIFTKIAKSLILKGFKSWHAPAISLAQQQKNATPNKNNM
jgi:hypothetical protein